MWLRKIRNAFWILAHPRYCLNWIKFNRFLKKNPTHPWISPECVNFLATVLTKEMNGFEWGSGRSTHWYGKKLATLTSIEEHQGWHGEVSKQLSEASLTNCNCLYVPVQVGKEDPKESAYVNAISKFKNESLQFIVVDGNYRHECIQAALPKLSKGGLLLVDNTNWFSDLSKWGVPLDYEIIHKSDNVVTETTVWRKP